MSMWELNENRCTKSWSPFLSTVLCTEMLPFHHCTPPPRWSACNKKRLTLTHVFRGLNPWLSLLLHTCGKSVCHRESVCQGVCVSMLMTWHEFTYTAALWCLGNSLFLTSSTTPGSDSLSFISFSMIPEPYGDWCGIEVPFSTVQFHNVSFFASWPVEGLCVDWILLQEESSLMRVIRTWGMRERQVSQTGGGKSQRTF